MTWASASDFFHMGGYGLYVWGSYAMTLLLMLAEPWLALQRHQQALHDDSVDTLDSEETRL